MLKEQHHKFLDMNDRINRIVILEDKIKGDLHRCNVCGINFSAIQPCLFCAVLIEKEKELLI